MTEPKRPLRIFLCHSPTDRDAVYALYTRLTHDGMDVWLGKENLLPGQDSELEIRKAVCTADVVIVCLSKEFNQAGYRQKEVRIALNEAEKQPDGTIFIIPVRLEECDILESLKRWRWIDLFEVDAYEKLMRALRVRADDVGVELRISKGSTSDLAKKPITKQQTKPALKNKVSNRQNKSEQKKRGSSTIPKLESKVRELPKPEIIIAIISVIVTLLVGILSSPITEKWLVASLAPTSTPAFTVHPETFPSISYPTEIIDIDLAGNYISMHLIPAGKFAMGSDYGVYDGNLVQVVDLDAFYIDIKEVTNNLYEACVSAGACQPPKNTNSYARNSYYANVDFDNYPVINVNWHMAKSYCVCGGANLSTYAEWEKAARGGLEGKSYPWGNIAPACKKDVPNGAKFNDKAECAATDTEAVGNYSPNGFGLYDMAGNVWEWTSSLYRPYPYVSTDGRENLELSGARVVRGGSWSNLEYLQRVSFRNKGDSELISYIIGFRCARSP